MFYLHGVEAKDTRVKINDMRNLFKEKELEKTGNFSQLENDTHKAMKKEKEANKRIELLVG